MGRAEAFQQVPGGAGGMGDSVEGEEAQGLERSATRSALRLNRLFRRPATIEGRTCGLGRSVERKRGRGRGRGV